jgi:DHA1 family bicyclomycin/chloramphenicol resistance-like MFS transporter
LRHADRLTLARRAPIVAGMSSAPDVRYLDQTTPPHISTLILLAGLSALAMNIFLPSLPGMVAYFDTEYRLIQLSVALYLGVNAALQVLMGPISDRWGRRPVILWGLGLFLVATLGCIVAPNVYVFLTFRMIQSSVVVAMVLSRAIVRDMVPQDRAASMIGYVTMGMAVVPMIGPAFGGVLDEIFGWQANFWALFILGAMLFALCWRDLGETAPLTGRTLMQQFRDYPALLTSRRFWGYSLAAGLSSGSFFAYLGGAPFVGDQVFGLSPSLLGVLFGAPAIGYFLGNFASGRFSTRFGVNRMVLWGALFNAGGIGINVALFHLGLGSPLVFFGLMTFMGLGNGMVIPNATAGALSIRPDLAGTASGLSGAMMIGFGAALSALAGTMLTPGSGALVLLWIMFATAVAAVITILLVIRRERRLALV